MLKSVQSFDFIPSSKPESFLDLFDQRIQRVGEILSSRWGALWVFSIAFLTPIHGLLLTFHLLLLSDFILGIWAALKRNEFDFCDRLIVFFKKFIIYHICILSAFCVDRFALGNNSICIAVFGAAVAMAEFISILRNGNSIIGGSVFDDIIKKLGSKKD